MTTSPVAPPSPTRKRLLYWGSRLLAIALGIGLAMLLFEIGLRVLNIRVEDRRPRGVDMGLIKFTTGIGDIFINRPGAVAPPADPYQILSEHPLRYDADGFRVPAKPADQYAVLAIGDSFTEGPNTALPWPDVLAQYSGLAVYNMGFRGYGPVEEAKVLRSNGLSKQAHYLIVGFFEGNDLADAGVSQWTTYQLPSVMRTAFEPFDPNKKIWESDHTGPYQYPVQLQNGENMAFMDGYASVLNAERATYEQSVNWKITREAWQQMAQDAAAMCKIIVYIPDKAHIYIPQVIPEDRDRALTTFTMQVLDKDKLMMEQATRPSFDLYVSRMDNLRSVIRNLAESLGYHFLDLTPAFQVAAQNGPLLYYVYDTHWNQAGQTLAGQLIADYLATKPCG